MLTGLESATKKLDRVPLHIKAIKEVVAEYSRGNPHSVIFNELDGETTFHILKDAPIDVAIIAGEAIYQIRSAIDHLAADLVGRNHSGGVLPAKWNEKCFFPLWHELPKSGPTPPLCPGSFEKVLPGISVRAHTFIESVQPYYGLMPNPGLINLSLGYLGTLSNIDKHRRLNAVFARGLMTEIVTQNDEVIHADFKPIDHGAQVQRLDWLRDRVNDGAMHVEQSFSTFVAINEREVLGDAATYSVDYVLQLVLDQVKMVIIPGMADLIENP